MIINMYGYDTILTDAKNFYTNCADGNADEAGKYLDAYFTKAKMPVVNPCSARMAMQQAQTDVYAKLRIDRAEGTITPEQYKSKYTNMMKGSFQLNRDSDLIELEKRIKTTFPKTWKKRLSIIPGLMDNEFTGLSNVKTAKGLKKFQYFLRKIINK